MNFFSTFVVFIVYLLCIIIVCGMCYIAEYSYRRYIYMNCEREHVNMREQEWTIETWRMCMTFGHTQWNIQLYTQTYTHEFLFDFCLLRKKHLQLFTKKKKKIDLWLFHFAMFHFEMVFFFDFSFWFDSWWRKKIWIIQKTKIVFYFISISLVSNKKRKHPKKNLILHSLTHTHIRGKYESPNKIK